MKTIFLIRHAKSDWGNIGLRDFDRPLSVRGLRDAPQMSAFLASRGVEPDILISSPANRAQTTAGYFADAFGIPKNHIDLRREIYEAEVEDIQQLVQDLDDHLNTICLFGHNPTFTHFANLFTTDYIDNISTCGIVQIEANVKDWADFNEQNAKVVDKWFPKELKVKK
jgi:phosphohistidine phosphatase